MIDMRLSLGLLCSTLFGLAVSAHPDAPVVTNAKDAASYIANFPSSSKVVGNVSFAPAFDGYVNVKVSLTSLPDVGGPFKYHVHVAPVPASQPPNCTATLGHLDPYNATESPPCDKSTPAKCQIGDLSGKYGTLTSDDLATKSTNSSAGVLYNDRNSYADRYIRLAAGADGLDGRSIVFHNAAGDRIACANLEKQSGIHTQLSPGLGNGGQYGGTPITGGATATPGVSPTGALLPSTGLGHGHGIPTSASGGLETATATVTASGSGQSETSSVTGSGGSPSTTGSLLGQAAGMQVDGWVKIQLGLAVGAALLMVGA